MGLVLVDTCYVNSSENKIHQCKNWEKTKCFSINYLHLIQLATEMHTLVMNAVAQDPSSLCGVMTTKRVPQAKSISSRMRSMRTPALLVNHFFLTALEFLNSTYLHVQPNIIILLLIIVIIFIISKAKYESSSMQKAILGLFLIKPITIIQILPNYVFFITSLSYSSHSFAVK